MRVGLISVPVRDLAPSQVFYTAGLGFSVIGRDQRAGWLILNSCEGGASIALVTALMVPGTLKGLVLLVPDLDAAISRLRVAGTSVPADRIRHVAEGSWLTLDDPDGNTLIVQQGHTRRRAGPSVN